MTTTTAPDLVVGRLSHDQYFAKVVERANQGRRVIVAADYLAVARHHMRELQRRVGLVDVAYFRWASGAELIDMGNGGSIVFTSIQSTRLRGLTADTVLFAHRADVDYRAMAAVSVLTSSWPELFEIDA